MNDSRIKNRWPIAKEGFPFVLAGCGITLLFFFLGWLIPAIFFSLITLFILYFFRDPERPHNPAEKSVLTPADGKVLEVRKVPSDDNPLGHAALKVSIFMSLFDVHVNRIPVQGTIRKIDYTPGKFFSADLDKASRYNENNRVLMETVDSQKLAVIQIAGLVARRIACWVEEGDKVSSGQRFGLIRFGSRLEVFLPADSRMVVQKGDKVKAGQTVIGYLS
ncbi:MAG: phosphatidylserine decarboxylase family protein [Deltaproteobacteria bacterium]|nr:phosphatidylserine decarboxylase family protein [Deltaproteobacteria bacterium]